jgi:hypothetical protein
MRNVCVVAVVLLLIIGLNTQSIAQVPGAPVGLSKGIKGGFNFANFRGDDADGSSSRKALVVGGFVKINLLNILAIQPEVLYSGKGAESEINSVKTTTKITYLEIPVLVRINAINAGVLHAGLIGGPSFAFTLSAKANDTDIKDSIKSNDMGAVIGIGADIGAGVISLIGDVRYTMGLNSIDDSGMDLDIKNGVFSVMIGIGF